MEKGRKATERYIRLQYRIQENILIITGLRLDKVNVRPGMV
jgi:hypothetical protein